MMLTLDQQTGRYLLSLPSSLHGKQLIPLKIKLAPVNFSLSNAKLNKGESVQIVRGEAIEVGISYDGNSLRHYFFFGKNPVAQKFSLKLTVRKEEYRVEKLQDKS